MVSNDQAKKCIGPRRIPPAVKNPHRMMVRLGISRTRRNKSLRAKVESSKRTCVEKIVEKFLDNGCKRKGWGEGVFTERTHTGLGPFEPPVVHSSGGSEELPRKGMWSILSR